MNNKEFNVGIIGLGIGMRHAASYNAHPRCRVTCLCDFSADKLMEAGKVYPGAKLTQSASDVILDPEIQIVSVASYDNYHHEQIMGALENGKHVFAEKPLCLFRREAIEVKSLLSKHPELRLSSNMNLRTTPRFINLRNAIRADDFGEVFYVEGDYLWGRIEKLLKGWRRDMPFYSIVLGGAVHMIDCIIWLTGELPLQVTGFGNNICSRSSSFPFRDFAAILMQFKNGMVAMISANSGCIHPHFHSLTVYGTKKTFIQNHLGAVTVKTTNEDEIPHSAAGDYPGYRKGQIIYTFVDSILYPGKQPLVSSSDVFNVMSICYAAEEAIETGKSIPIKYI